MPNKLGHSIPSLKIRAIWLSLKVSYLISIIEIIKYTLVKRKKYLGKKKALEGQIKVQMKSKTFCLYSDTIFFFMKKILPRKI